jgi:branched-chain amino acid transport system ATP-binding protein
VSTLLQARDLQTYYGNAHILHGTSIEVEQGECLALLGRNGVGKSTLAATLIGFLAPRGGEIVFDGQQVAGLPSRSIVQAGVALVPQGRRVFRSLSVEENLRVARIQRNGDGGARWDVDRVYELFPRLQERRRQSAATLSGGEQQMLAIGRALMSSPKLLILDEPTEGLAPVIVEGILRTLRELKSTSVSILLLEQRVQFALALADRVNAMSTRGEITFRGSRDEFAATQT